MAGGYHIEQHRYGSFPSSRKFFEYHCFKEQNKMENKEPAILIVRLDHVTATHDNKVVESNLNPVYFFFLFRRCSSCHLSFPTEVKFHYKVKIRLKKATHDTVWQFQGNQNTTGVFL